jgi:hypothetical protein
MRSVLRARITKVALVLCLMVVGTAIEARAGCQYVRGGITETVIPSANDPFGRVVGNVNGVLNGVSTAYVTSLTPSGSTSSDVFVTSKGDMLTGTGVVTLAPIPGAPPGEFAVHVTLTIDGGAGKYTGASGTITFEGQAHDLFGGPGVGTFDVVYQGSVCGPSLQADGH